MKKNPIKKVLRKFAAVSTSFLMLASMFPTQFTKVQTVSAATYNYSKIYYLNNLTPPNLVTNERIFFGHDGGGLNAYTAYSGDFRSDRVKNGAQILGVNYDASSGIYTARVAYNNGPVTDNQSGTENSINNNDYYGFFIGQDFEFTDDKKPVITVRRWDGISAEAKEVNQVSSLGYFANYNGDFLKERYNMGNSVYKWLSLLNWTTYSGGISKSGLFENDPTEWKWLSFYYNTNNGITTRFNRYSNGTVNEGNLSWAADSATKPGGLISFQRWHDGYPGGAATVFVEFSFKPKKSDTQAIDYNKAIGVFYKSWDHNEVWTYMSYANPTTAHWNQTQNRLYVNEINRTGIELPTHTIRTYVNDTYGSDLKVNASHIYYTKASDKIPASNSRATVEYLYGSGSKLSTYKSTNAFTRVAISNWNDSSNYTEYNGGSIINYNGRKIQVTVKQPTYQEYSLANNNNGLLDSSTASTNTVNSYAEIIYDDVTTKDTDDDGLYDWEEVEIYGTDPTKVDSDGDGKADFIWGAVKHMNYHENNIDTRLKSDKSGVTEIVQADYFKADVIQKSYDSAYGDPGLKTNITPGGVYNVVQGTDPQVQKPLFTKSTGKRGDVIRGIVAPNRLVSLVIYDRSKAENDPNRYQYLGETMSDNNGNYTLVVGKKIKRLSSVNAYGNRLDITRRSDGGYTITSFEDIPYNYVGKANDWMDLEVRTWASDSRNLYFNQIEKGGELTVAFEAEKYTEPDETFTGGLEVNIKLTPVQNLAALTTAEKDAVRQRVIEAYKDQVTLTTGTVTITDTNGSKKTVNQIDIADDGSVKIYFNDTDLRNPNSYKTIAKEDTVIQGPVGQNKQINVGGTIPNAKDFISNASAIDAIDSTATYTLASSPVLSNASEQTFNTTVTVSYKKGEQTFNVDVPVTLSVVGAANDRHDPKLAVADHVGVKKPDALTDEEKSAVVVKIKEKNSAIVSDVASTKEASEIEAGFTVAANGDTTIRYQDGTSDTVTNTVYQLGQGGSVEVFKGQSLPEASQAVQNASAATADYNQMPSGSYAWKGTIATNTVGTTTQTVVFTPTDTSSAPVQEISVQVIVKDNLNTTNTPSAPAATFVKDPASLIDEEKVTVANAVKTANSGLPYAESANADEQVAGIKVGNDGSVTIRYSDNSTDTLSGNVYQDAIAKTGVSTVTNVAVSAKDMIANATEDAQGYKALPSTVSYTFKAGNEPDFTTAGNNKSAIVVVDYGNGVTKEVPVNYTVTTSHADSTESINGLDASDKVLVKNVDDKSTWTTAQIDEIKTKLMAANADNTNIESIEVIDKDSVKVTFKDTSSKQYDLSSTLVRQQAHGGTLTTARTVEVTDSAKIAAGVLNHSGAESGYGQMPADTVYEIVTTGIDWNTKTTRNISVKATNSDGEQTFTMTLVITDSDADKATINDLNPTFVEQYGVNVSITESGLIEEEFDSKNENVTNLTSRVVNTDGSITLTFNDGSKKVIPYSETTAQKGVGKTDLVFNQNQVVDPKSTIANLLAATSTHGKLPAGTTVTGTIDTATPGNKQALLTVTNDQGTQDVVVTYTVKTNDNETVTVNVENIVKTAVKNRNSLDNEEKAAVAQAIFDQIDSSYTASDFSTDNIKVNNDGSAEITFKDGTKKTIALTDTIYQKPLGATMDIFKGESITDDTLFIANYGKSAVDENGVTYTAIEGSPTVTATAVSREFNEAGNFPNTYVTVELAGSAREVTSTVNVVDFKTPEVRLVNIASAGITQEEYNQIIADIKSLNNNSASINWSQTKSSLNSPFDLRVKLVEGDGVRYIPAYKIFIQKAVTDRTQDNPLAISKGQAKDTNFAKSLINYSKGINSSGTLFGRIDRFEQVQASASANFTNDSVMTGTETYSRTAMSPATITILNPDSLDFNTATTEPIPVTVRVVMAGVTQDVTAYVTVNETTSDTDDKFNIDDDFNEGQPLPVNNPNALTTEDIEAVKEKILADNANRTEGTTAIDKVEIADGKVKIYYDDSTIAYNEYNLRDFVTYKAVGGETSIVKNNDLTDTNAKEAIQNATKNITVENSEVVKLPSTAAYTFTNAEDVDNTTVDTYQTTVQVSFTDPETQKTSTQTVEVTVKVVGDQSDENDPSIAEVDRIPVKDPTSPTTDDLAKLLEKLKEGNDGEGYPLDSTTPVTFDEDKGKIIIKYTDGSTDEFDPSTFFVQEAVGGTVSVDPTNESKESVLTSTIAEQAVKNSAATLGTATATSDGYGKLPEGTAYEFVDTTQVDLTTEGEYPATVKVTIGETEQVVNVTVKVNKNYADTYNPTVAVEDKVPVKDPSALSDDEKSAIVDAVKEATSEFADKVESVTIDGDNVKITYKDGVASTDTIAISDVIVQDAEPGSVSVDKTTESKDTVLNAALAEKAIKNSASSLGTNTTSEEGYGKLPAGTSYEFTNTENVDLTQSGTYTAEVTITVPVGNGTTYTMTKEVTVVVNKDMNESHPLDVSEKTPVKDPSNPTGEELETIKEKIVDKLNDTDPDFTADNIKDITVDVENGKVVVTYTDDSVGEMDLGNAVVQKAVGGSVTIPYGMSEETLKANTDLAKKAIANATSDTEDGYKTIPSGAAYVFNDVSNVQYTTTNVGGTAYTATVDVTIDGTVQTVEVQVFVDKSIADKLEDEEKLPTIQDKLIVENVTDLSDEEKQSLIDKVIADNSELVDSIKEKEDGTKDIVVSETGEITITYTDGSTSTIAPNDAIAQKAIGGEITVDKNTVLDVGHAIQGIKNANSDYTDTTTNKTYPKLATNDATVSYEWHTKPSTVNTTYNTPVEGVVKVTVNGKEQLVSVMVNVRPELSDLRQPTTATIRVPMGKVLTDLDAKNTITNYGDEAPKVPTSATIDWKEGAKPTSPENGSEESTIGGTVVVTYSDGSVDEVSANVTFVPNKDFYPTPTSQQINVSKGTDLGDTHAKLAIVDSDNTTKFPEGTTFTWTDKPDTTEAGTKTGSITVTYPDGTSVLVENVSVKVLNDAEDLNPMGGTVKVKKNTTTPTIPNDPYAKEAIDNVDALPSDATYTFTDEQGNPVELSRAVENTTHNTFVKVTYPDQTYDIVPVTVEVINEVIAEGGKIVKSAGITKEDLTTEDAKKAIVNNVDLANDVMYAFNLDTLPEGELATGAHKPTVNVTNATEEPQNVPVYLVVLPEEPTVIPKTVNKNEPVTPTDLISNMDKQTWSNLTGDERFEGDITFTFGEDGETEFSSDQPGDHEVTIKVTYPGMNNPAYAYTTIHVRSDAEKAVFLNTKPVTMDKGKKLDDYINGENNDLAKYALIDIPENTKTVKWKPVEPEPLNEDNIPYGDYQRTVVVTFNDGSTLEKVTTIHVPSYAELNNPIGNRVEKDQVKNQTLTVDETLAKDELIKDFDDISEVVDSITPITPESIDLGAPGDTTVTMTVVYTDGSKDENVHAIVHVKQLKEMYTPEPGTITVTQGDTLTNDDASSGIINFDDLPEGTTAEFEDEEIDTNTPGSKTVNVIIRYEDGSEDIVQVTIKVNPKPVPPTPTSSNNDGEDKPKWTCADEGKVWNEEKQVCEFANTPTKVVTGGGQNKPTTPTSSEKPEPAQTPEVTAQPTTSPQSTIAPSATPSTTAKPTTPTSKQGGWSLLTVVFAILAAIIYALTLGTKKIQDTVEHPYATVSKLIGILSTLAGGLVVLFFEKFNQPMVMIDKFTILTFVVLVVNVGLLFIGKIEKEAE